MKTLTCQDAEGKSLDITCGEIRKGLRTRQCVEVEKLICQGGGLAGQKTYFPGV